VRHVDIGSGAGFPALIMRAVLPQMRLTLVEPRLKRAVFLETAAAELGLDGVAVCHATIEEYLGQTEEKTQIVSWKALRLKGNALERLLAGPGAEAEYWIFHAAELPFERPDQGPGPLELRRRESFPGKRGWFLSVMARWRPEAGRKP
jgi:hypothetical protein